MLVRAVVFTVTCIGVFGSDAMAERPRDRDRSPLERLRDRDAPLRWRRSRREFLPQELQVKPLEEVLNGEPLESAIPIPSGWAPVEEEETLTSQETVDTPAEPEQTVSSPRLVSPQVTTPARPFPMGTVVESVQQSIVENAIEKASTIDVPEPTPVADDAAVVEQSEKPSLTPVPNPYLDRVPMPAHSLIESEEPRVADSFSIETPAQSGKTILPPALPSSDSVQVAQVPKPGETLGLKEEAIDVFRPITQIEPFYDYSPTSSTKNAMANAKEPRFPEVVNLPENGTTDRMYADMHYHWHASNLHHNPLYFEDVSLERYGHAYPPMVQPFVSVGKAGLQLVGMPYQLALNPAWNEEYVLGYYRPGDPAPHLRYRVPFNKKAALTATAAYTGLIFLFP